MRTREEINRLADEKLAELGAEKVAAFLNSLDRDPSNETALPRATPEQVAALNADLAKDGLTLTMIPQGGHASLDSFLPRLAADFAAAHPDEDEADILRQFQTIAASSKVTALKAKQDKAIVDAAVKHHAEPEPYVHAINELNAAKQNADRNAVSLDPIAVLPLVGDLLAIGASVKTDIAIKLKGGRKEEREFLWVTGVVKEFRLLINALSGFILANAALAKRHFPSALPIWKRAIVLQWKLINTDANGKLLEKPGVGPWPRKSLDELFALIQSAREEAYSDALVTTYNQNGKAVV